MQIEVYINDKRKYLNQGSTLEHVIQALNLPAVGCVFAVNDLVIPNSQWPSYQLNSGDQISLFQAIAGG